MCEKGREDRVPHRGDRVCARTTSAASRLRQLPFQLPPTALPPTSHPSFSDMTLGQVPLPGKPALMNTRVHLMLHELWKPFLTKSRGGGLDRQP